MNNRHKQFVYNGIVGGVIASYFLLKVATVNAASLDPDLPVTTCGEMDEPGIYVIAEDFNVPSANCFTVQANNVTIIGTTTTPTITGSSGYSFVTVLPDVLSGNAYGTTTIQNLNVNGFTNLATAKGRNDTGPAYGVNGGNGGNITLININSTSSIHASGGSSNSGTGGAGGTVTLSEASSVSGSIRAYGGYSYSGTGGDGGAGGTITLSEASSVSGYIHAYGGSSSSGTGGNAGTITLTNSTSGDINAYGGSSVVYGGNTSSGGNGGNVFLTNSTSTGSIVTFGGRTAINYSEFEEDGGDAGNVTLINSSVSGNINAFGGYSMYGLAGDGGTITLTNSTSGNISSNGAYSIGGIQGDSGDVTLVDSISANIDSSSNSGKRGGDAGNVSLNNSTSGGIYAFDRSRDPASLAGTVSLINNSISGYITVSAGGIYNQIASGKTGGQVTITDSTSGNINSKGGFSYYTNGGMGGTITLTRAEVGTINIMGGYSGIKYSVDANGADGGMGGTVSLTNSNSGNIIADGGYSYGGINWIFEDGGNGGQITLVSSDSGNISAQGGSSNSYYGGIKGNGGTVDISGTDMTMFASNPNPTLNVDGTVDGTITVNGSILFGTNENEVWTGNASSWLGTATWQFLSNSENQGTVKGNTDFRDTSINQTGADVIGTCQLFDDSVNNGTCDTVVFKYGYFFKPGLTDDWDDPLNWFVDASTTIALGFAPTSTDETIYLAGTTTGPSATTTVGSIKVADTKTGGGIFGIDISKVTGFTGASFFNGGFNTGIVNGIMKLFSSTLGGFSSINQGGSVTGDVEFYNDTYNDADSTSFIGGIAKFFNTSYNAITGVLGIAQFNDTSENRGTVTDGTFNDSSSNTSTGDVTTGTFNTRSTNEGSVDDATFNDSTVNLGTFISALFNDFSRNEGIATGNATFETGTKNTGTILGDATFEGDSYNMGTTTNATFIGEYSENGGYINTDVWEAQGAGNRNWYGITSTSNGDVYAVVYGGDIYKQTGGTGAFVAQNVGDGTNNWSSITSTPSGDVYAIISNGDIYKQTGGTGVFVAQGAGNKDWLEITSAPNGDVYAIVNNGDIYKQTGGTGVFAAQSAGNRNWKSITSTPNGDMYAVAYYDDIYKLDHTNQGAGFVAEGAGTYAWNSITSTPNGDVYVAVYDVGGYIYKKEQDSNTWEEQTGAPYSDFYFIYSTSKGEVYTNATDGNLYKEVAPNTWEIQSGGFGNTTFTSTPQGDLYIAVHNLDIYKNDAIFTEGFVSGIKTRLYNAANQQYNLLRNFAQSAWTIVADNTLVKLLYRNLIDLFAPGSPTETTLVEQNNGVILAPFEISVGTSTPVTKCGVLDTASTTYILQNNISNFSKDTCFIVTADDITLDGNNKTLDGTSLNNSVAIISASTTATTTGARAYDNLTIKNLTITQFDIAVDARGQNNTSGNGGQGGTLSFEDSIIRANILADGGDGTTDGGNAGEVSLLDTTTKGTTASTTISLDGGDSTSCGNGGNAGFLDAIDSEYDLVSAVAGTAEISGCTTPEEEENAGSSGSSGGSRTNTGTYTPPESRNTGGTPSTPSTPSTNNNGRSSTGGSSTALLKDLIKNTLNPLNLNPIIPFTPFFQVFSPNTIGQTSIPDPFQNFQPPGIINFINIPVNFLTNISKFLFAPLPQTVMEALKSSPGLAAHISAVGITNQQNIATLATKPALLTPPSSDETTPPGLFIVTSGEQTLSSYATYDKGVGGLAQLVKVSPSQLLYISLIPQSTGSVSATYLGQNIIFTQQALFASAQIETPPQGGRYVLKTESSPLPLLIEVIEPIQVQEQKKENIFIRFWRWLTT